MPHGLRLHAGHLRFTRFNAIAKLSRALPLITPEHDLTTFSAVDPNQDARLEAVIRLEAIISAGGAVTAVDSPQVLSCPPSGCRAWPNSRDRVPLGEGVGIGHEVLGSTCDRGDAQSMRTRGCNQIGGFALHGEKSAGSRFGRPQSGITVRNLKPKLSTHFSHIQGPLSAVGSGAQGTAASTTAQAPLTGAHNNHTYGHGLIVPRLCSAADKWNVPAFSP